MGFQLGFYFCVVEEDLESYVGEEGFNNFYTKMLNIKIGQNNINAIKLFKNDYFVYLRTFESYIYSKAFSIYC